MDAAESFEALAAGQLAVPDVTRRLMFGRDTLLAGGHPFAFRDGERVAVKLPTAGELVAAGEGLAPRMGSRVMRRWVSLPLQVSEELGARMTAAREHVTR